MVTDEETGVLFRGKFKIKTLRQKSDMKVITDASTSIGEEIRMNNVGQHN